MQNRLCATGGRRLLAVLLVAFLALGGVGARADLNAAKQWSMITPGDVRLSPWPGCEVFRDDRQRPKLCKTAVAPLDDRAYQFLSIQLRRKVGYKAVLCEIDATVVDALAECSAEPRLRNYLIVGWLMEQLAENWERHDAPRRADALYEHAYGLYGIVGITEFDLMMRIRVAQRWAMLKLRMGDNDRARELGYIQAELARWDYERGSPPSAKFVEALGFLADLLEKIDRSSEADAARKEARAMAAIPTVCQGSCTSDYEGTYGGVREKR